MLQNEIMLIVFCLIIYTTVYLGGRFFKKLIILFSKDALFW